MVLQKYLVEREGKRLQSLFPDLWLQLTFPDGNGVPAHRSQFMLHSRVTLLIPPYLSHPEIPVRLRNLAALRVINFFTTLALRRGVGGEAHPVSMPEAAVYEDTSSVLPHHDVRLSW